MAQPARRPWYQLNLGPLHEVNFRRYYIGQTLSGFGDSLVPLALAFVVLDLTGSMAALGLVLLASRVPITVFTLVGGVLGDRLRRRDVMIAADLVRLVLHAATAGLLLWGHAQLWELIVLQAGAGTAAAFFNPAATGLVQTVVTKQQLQAANALLGISRNSFSLLSLGLSGALVATVGGAWAFALNAATFAVSVWYLAKLELNDRWSPAKSSFVQQLVEGAAYVRAHPWLLITIAYTALLNALVIAPLMVLGPSVAKTRLGGAPSWAAIGIAMGIGAIVGSASSLRLHPPRPLAMALGAVLGTVPMIVLLAAAAPTWAIALGALAFGAQSSFYIAVSATMIQVHVTPAAISRVSSYNSFGALILAPLGFAFAGLAADAVGTAKLLWFCAGWVVVSTLVALSFRQVRRLGAVAPADQAGKPVAGAAARPPGGDCECVHARTE